MTDEPIQRRLPQEYLDVRRPGANLDDQTLDDFSDWFEDFFDWLESHPDRAAVDAYRRWLAGEEERVIEDLNAAMIRHTIEREGPAGLIIEHGDGRITHIRKE
jgi:hypothetical protein